MTLTCDFYYEPVAGDVVWNHASKFTQHQRKRAPKCCSCGGAVPAGVDCLEFPRHKIPDNEVEFRIYGEGDWDSGPPRASAFMCWECGWRYLGLAGHGYAINIYDDMRKLMIEHDELTAAGHGGCR